MISKPPADRSHRRFNPLLGSWVLVSPHRLDRPWQGARSQPKIHEPVAYDPQCYLCPGNVRNNGSKNPRYEGVYVFDNDYPALLNEQATGHQLDETLFRWQPESGVCRVVCFSEHHSHTLSELTDAACLALIDVWSEQTAELSAKFPDGSVQIFENKGEMMGCSNPHPHNQIWAQNALPTELHTELLNCAGYLKSHDTRLFADYLDRELVIGERLVVENDSFAVVVPFWATWPFETLVLCKRPVARIDQLSQIERRALGLILRSLSRAYDALFAVSFPYSSGVHQAPGNGRFDDCFDMHMHFFPPLLRSAEVRKFMVGYEMLAEAQRDITPEAAAQALRDCVGVG